ncbi:MAG: hypothetical protein ACRC8Y_08455, partial [Chroococcales cyanobacterium]
VLPPVSIRAARQHLNPQYEYTSGLTIGDFEPQQCQSRRTGATLKSIEIGKIRYCASNFYEKK